MRLEATFPSNAARAGFMLEFVELDVLRPREVHMSDTGTVTLMVHGEDEQAIVDALLDRYEASWAWLE